MSRFVVLCMLICMPGILWAACPDGFTEYLGPSGGLIRDINGNCGQLCGAGVTSLKTSNGYSFDLFETKNTDRAISVKVGDTICYADLATGAMSNTLNVKAGDMTYHANPDSGNLCPITYKLSYSCGDGATGTPPETREIGWGDLYNCPDSAESCRKPGYSFNGWKIDSTSLTKGNVYNYKYTADKTMVAQWRANSYGGALFCNYCTDGINTDTAYVSGRYNSSFTPTSSPSCVNPYKMTLDSYQVYDMWGNDTGKTLTPGVSATWSWPGNIQLRAKWSGGTQTIPSAPARYTLSYSCGDGATGTPPESHSVGYKLGYYAPYDAGTCVKPGYYLSGWKIGSLSMYKGSMYSYTYTTDKTVVAQWSANDYGAAYLCNNGTTVSSYLKVKYGNSVTPSTTVCTAADGATFAGWRVLDTWGNDTGDTVAPGASFTWNYPYNIQLQAIWE